MRWVATSSCRSSCCYRSPPCVTPICSTARSPTCPTRERSCDERPATGARRRSSLTQPPDEAAAAAHADPRGPRTPVPAVERSRRDVPVAIPWHDAELRRLPQTAVPRRALPVRCQPARITRGTGFGRRLQRRLPPSLLPRGRRDAPSPAPARTRYRGVHGTRPLRLLRVGFPHDHHGDSRDRVPELLDGRSGGLLHRRRPHTRPVLLRWALLGRPLGDPPARAIRKGHAGPGGPTARTRP